MQEFLASNQIEITELVDAKKTPIPAQATLRLARETKRLISMRGQRVSDLDLARSAPTDEEIKALIVGPSGNLRAPALRTRQTLLVGFHEETLRQFFGPVSQTTVSQTTVRRAHIARKTSKTKKA